MSERKDWRRKQWSEYYKELYQTTTPAQAGTNVWNLWNSSSNKNKEQLNNKNLFLLSLATYRQPVSIGNIVFNITYSSQPIYSTWANWWDGIYWWELEQWEMWYTALKSHYGSVEAKNRWVNAWSYADNFSWSGYQDAIGVILHVYDFHMEMCAKSPEEKEFHIKQANRLRDWLKDVKDYIEEKESG